MSRKAPITLMVCLVGLCCISWMPAPAPKSQEQIKLLHADRLYFNEALQRQLNREARCLVGNVQFDHEGTLMFCDSALLYTEDNSFDAFGNVRMKQGDTLELVGDRLYYYGTDRLAQMRDNVILRHNGTTLFTEFLDYERNESKGSFHNGGTLVDGNSQLTSNFGNYYADRREAEFFENVELVNPLPPDAPETRLTTNEGILYYNTRTGIAHVVGPSNIEHGVEDFIYTENGYYDLHGDSAWLLDRSKLQRVFKHLTGDSICYSKKTAIAKAFGNVIYEDRDNRNMYTGNYAYYDDLIGYSEAADSALLIDYSQQDTAWCHADSFRVYTFHMDTDSMYRKLHAYYHVRAFRADAQAVCDSMVYDGKDSCATMYKDPILWQGNQQVLGEKIITWVNDSTIDSTYVVNQALTVEKLDSLHYNQVSSREMHTYFDQNTDPYLMTAEGNVLINYYPLDEDSLMIGLNSGETSKLRIHLEGRQVKYIWMAGGGSCVLYPLDQSPNDKIFLPTFAWFDYMRPLDKNDVFVWRPKKAGTELKESIRRDPTRQTLLEAQEGLNKKTKKKAAKNKETSKTSSGGNNEQTDSRHTGMGQETEKE